MQTHVQNSKYLKLLILAKFVNVSPATHVEKRGRLGLARHLVKP